ncbi:hypothetical protein FRC12_006639 [Ceratobasidium sp. 428]|nr:hypothetical protein FRC12_006639 [Ceratobasidium sp. 428]
MSRPRSSLFLHLKSEPSPDANPGLWEHRLRQRRPISTNPFVPDEPGAGYEITDVESPGPIRRPTLLDGGRSDFGTKQSSREEVNPDSKNYDVVWGEQMPEWLNLFYDLAWTATFSSLTSNNKFKAPWDSVTYIVFFTVAWWIWTSQVFYTSDFYTDDWFHLLVVFIQLIIFGALAAITRGIDVSTYILHSPGSTEWESNDINTITPELYSAERLTKLSFEAIAIVVALSRLLLLVQHLRVAIYAKFTARNKSYPLRLLIVPAALAVSTALFFVAFVITKRHGEERTGAKAKFILWAAGLLVEVVAHIVRFQLDINEGIRLKSHGSIVNRFSGITTIIIGEGINAIAGTFYAIEKAPGFGGPTGAGIICCAIIIFFLVYLYFEGAAPIKTVRRRAAWAMVHLPWLLSTILLLEGVKNQLLLSSFMNSAVYLLDQADNVLFSDSNATMAQLNDTLRPLLLKSGMTWDDQYQKLADLIDQNMTASNATELDDATENELIYVWYLRLRMSTTLNTYINFMDNDTIADDVQETVRRYQTDYAFAYQDYTSNYADILNGFVWDLIKSVVTNARYISGLCGMTFICLATLNLIQAWPRDRFHWASIISRYAMGIVMMLLLLLNLGKYQTYFTPDDAPPSQRAGVINWIDAHWVLPTLALAYGIQFIVDTAIVYAAVYFSGKSRSEIRQSRKAA